MNANDETRRWTVRGIVQGVGFRVFVRRIALELDLRGAVRNTREGAVDVVASGPVDALEQLERRLREGPAGADVQSVERAQHDVTATGLGPSFMIVP